MLYFCSHAGVKCSTGGRFKPALYVYLLSYINYRLDNLQSSIVWRQIVCSSAEIADRFVKKRTTDADDKKADRSVRDVHRPRRYAVVFS